MSHCFNNNYISFHSIVLVTQEIVAPVGSILKSSVLSTSAKALDLGVSPQGLRSISSQGLGVSLVCLHRV